MKNEIALKIAHIHATYLNIGDEAIIDSVYHLLDKYKPMYYDITSASSKDKRIIMRCNDYSLVKVALLIKESDIVVLGGGELLSEFMFPYKCMVLALLMNKPILCIGVGVNTTLIRKVGKHFIRYILRVPKLIITRDRESYNELIEEYKLNKDKIVLSSDIFYSYYNNIITEKTSVEEDKYIVVSLRSTEYSSKKWGSEQYSQLASAIDYLIDKYKYKVKLLPMLSNKRNVYRKYKLPDDEESLCLLYERIIRKSSVAILDEMSDYLTVLKMLNNAEALIATRLHTMIFASCLSTPFIILSYSKKTDSFARDNKIEEVLLDISTITKEKIVTTYEYLINNREEIVAKLKDIYDFNVKISKQYQIKIDDFFHQMKIK